MLHKYGNAVIVFNGYSDTPTTKDATHTRRCGRSVGPVVQCMPNFTVQLKIYRFLANSTNKQRFIDRLNYYLERAGCITKHAMYYADLLIVKTAIEQARLRDVIVIADNTDIIIVLCFHVSPTCNRIAFQPEWKRDSA